MYLQSRFGRPQGKGTFGTDHPPYSIAILDTGCVQINHLPFGVQTVEGVIGQPLCMWSV